MSRSVKKHSEYSRRFTKYSDFERYFFAGRALITLKSPTLVEHTYLIRKPTEEDQFPDDILFVYALHEDRLFYIGMIEGRKFRLTHASRYGSHTEIVKGIRYMMDMITYPNMIATTRMEVWHEGTCGKCGRPLKSKKALSTGLGRNCTKLLDEEF